MEPFSRCFMPLVWLILIEEKLRHQCQGLQPHRCKIRFCMATLEKAVYSVLSPFGWGGGEVSQDFWSGSLSLNPSTRNP